VKGQGPARQRGIKIDAAAKILDIARCAELLGAATDPEPCREGRIVLEIKVGHCGGVGHSWESRVVDDFVDL
jgi:hypothetical protein